jgi:hypothetical protein
MRALGAARQQRTYNRSSSVGCRQQRGMQRSIAARHVAAAGVASAERMLKTVSAENLGEDEIKSLLARPRIDFSAILGTVRSAQDGRHPPRRRRAAAFASAAFPPWDAC